MPDEGTFEFTTDPMRQMERETQQGQAIDAVKRMARKHQQALTYMEMIDADIQNAEKRLARRRQGRYGTTVAEGKRSRLHESIRAANSRRDTSPLSVEGIAPSPVPELTNYHYNPHTESAPTAQSGMAKFVGGLSGVNAALGGLVAAFHVAAAAFNEAATIKKQNYQGYGDIRTAVTRAATELHLDPAALLNQVTNSPNREGAMSFLDTMVARAQATGVRNSPAQFNAAFNAARNGSMTWQSITSLANQNAFYRMNRPGFAKGSFEGRFMDVQSGVNAFDFQMNTPDFSNMQSGENAMFNDAAWKAFAASNPFAASLWGSKDFRAFITAREAREGRAQYTDPSVMARTYDQTAVVGPKQSPIVGGGIDTTSGGRAAIDSAAKQLADAVSRALQNRSPAVRGSGTLP